LLTFIRLLSKCCQNLFFNFYYYFRIASNRIFQTEGSAAVIAQGEEGCPQPAVVNQGKRSTGAQGHAAPMDLG
jgi:hypothetical protein